jgi:nitroreductase
MEILEIIKERRTIREYLDEEVPQASLDKILEAGRWAPSGLNNQPWKFIIVKDKNTINEISKFTKYSNTIKGANQLIVVLLDKSESYDYKKDLQAIGACIQNMLLAAWTENIGVCWIGEILNRSEEVERFLKLPEKFELMAVLTIGIPKPAKRTSHRKELKDLIIKVI